MRAGRGGEHGCQRTIPNRTDRTRDVGTPVPAYPKGTAMAEYPVERELELEVADELVLAESARLAEPVADAPAGWLVDVPEAEAYETRLLSLRGAVEAVEVERADG